MAAKPPRDPATVASATALPSDPPPTSGEDIPPDFGDEPEEDGSNVSSFEADDPDMGDEDTGDLDPDDREDDEADDSLPDDVERVERHG